MQNGVLWVDFRSHLVSSYERYEPWRRQGVHSTKCPLHIAACKSPLESLDTSPASRKNSNKICNGLQKTSQVHNGLDHGIEMPD